MKASDIPDGVFLAAVSRARSGGYAPGQLGGERHRYVNDG